MHCHYKSPYNIGFASKTIKLSFSSLWWNGHNEKPPTFTDDNQYIDGWTICDNVCDIRVWVRCMLAFGHKLDTTYFLKLASATNLYTFLFYTEPANMSHRLSLWLLDLVSINILSLKSVLRRHDRDPTCLFRPRFCQIIGFSGQLFWIIKGKKWLFFSKIVPQHHHVPSVA